MCACPMPWISDGGTPRWANDIWKSFREPNNETLARCIANRSVGPRRRLELCPGAERFDVKLPGYLDARLRLSADLRSASKRILHGRAARSQGHRHEFAGLGAGADR